MFCRFPLVNQIYDYLGNCQMSLIPNGIYRARTQPTLGVGEKILTSDEMSLKQIYPDSRYEQFQVFFQESEKRLKGSALPRKYPRQLMFASLTDIFDEIRETVYVDTAHYNQKGNDLIAENIARLTQVFIEK